MSVTDSLPPFFRNTIECEQFDHASFVNNNSSNILKNLKVPVLNLSSEKPERIVIFIGGTYAIPEILINPLKVPNEGPMIYPEMPEIADHTFEYNG